MDVFASAFSRGRLYALDGDTSEIVAEIDYTPISSSSVVNPLWSAASTCDPLKDLKTAMRLVCGACGYSADLIVLGKDASDAFENADKVLAAYDKMNISPGSHYAALAEYGITLLGNYRGLPLYACEVSIYRCRWYIEVFRSCGQSSRRRIRIARNPCLCWHRPSGRRRQRDATIRRSTDSFGLLRERVTTFERCDLAQPTYSNSGRYAIWTVLDVI